MRGRRKCVKASKGEARKEALRDREEGNVREEDTGEQWQAGLVIELIRRKQETQIKKR